MEITFLGTSSGVPTRTRNVSSVAIKLTQRSEVWLLDCGEATQHQIMRSEVRLSQLTKIFITHLHGDHIFGIPGLLATCGLAGTVKHIDLYGPPGLAGFVDACLKYSETKLNYTIAVHRVKPGLVTEDADFAVFCAPLKHRVPAYGYRIVEKDRPGTFDVDKAKALGIPPGPLYGKLKQGETIVLPDGRTFVGKDFVGPPKVGKKVVYCTDTIYCDSAVDLAQQADVLIHEATFAHADADMAYQRLHSTSTMAAQVALGAQVKKLVITHFSPRYAPGNSILLEDLLNEARLIFPETYLAQDFLTLEV